MPVLALMLSLCLSPFAAADDALEAGFCVDCPPKVQNNFTHLKAVADHAAAIAIAKPGNSVVIIRNGQRFEAPNLPPIQVGDEIHAPHRDLVLSMRDGTEIKMNRGAKLVVDEFLLGDSESGSVFKAVFRFVTGIADWNVPSKTGGGRSVKVKTVVANIAVRGTSFRTALTQINGKDQLKVEVQSGEVEIESKDSTKSKLLKRGDQTTLVN